MRATVPDGNLASTQTMDSSTRRNSVLARLDAFADDEIVLGDAAGMRRGQRELAIDAARLEVPGSP